MNGKKIKLNDYKFTYGQETINLNIYSAFKDTKTNNKYVIYSYEKNNNKLFYGTYFERNNEAVIMTSKDSPKDIVKDFITSLLENKENKRFEIISLENIDSVEVIDEYSADFEVDLNKLYDLTMPKPVIQTKEEPKKKKPISIAAVFFFLFILVVIAFFFVNPEVIMGKNKEYKCTKTYFHESLPASVNEEISLVFNGRGKIISIDIISDYVFSDTVYYQEFKDKSYFYKYIEEGDTYKFEDSTYTYRLFSKVNTTEDFFLPTDEDGLTSYYEGNNYTCKVVETNE